MPFSVVQPAERPSTADLLELPGIKYVEPLTELVKTYVYCRLLPSCDTQADQ